MYTCVKLYSNNYVDVIKKCNQCFKIFFRRVDCYIFYYKDIMKYPSSYGYITYLYYMVDHRMSVLCNNVTNYDVHKYL